MTDAEAVGVDEFYASFRCHHVTEVYMLLYNCNIKKVQPKNPQMQHHPSCSREVFRHWWVTIIKTPKVRKMTKATLSWFILCFIPWWNTELCCRLCRPPLLPLPQINQQAHSELDIRERRGEEKRGEGGVCWRKILCFISRKLSQTPKQSNYNWPDEFVLKQAFKNNKRAISQHVMLQPDSFVISNISKHLAQKKTPHFFSWNLNWELSYIWTM